MGSCRSLRSQLVFGHELKCLLIFQLSKTLVLSFVKTRQFEYKYRSIHSYNFYDQTPSFSSSSSCKYKSLVSKCAACCQIFSEEKTASNHTKHKDIMVDRKGQRSRMAGGFARTEWAKSYGRIKMRWFWNGGDWDDTLIQNRKGNKKLGTLKEKAITESVRYGIWQRASGRPVTSLLHSYASTYHEPLSSRWK